MSEILSHAFFQYFPFNILLCYIGQKSIYIQCVCDIEKINYHLLSFY